MIKLIDLLGEGKAPYHFAQRTKDGKPNRHEIYNIFDRETGEYIARVIENVENRYDRKLMRNRDMVVSLSVTNLPGKTFKTKKAAAEAAYAKWLKDKKRGGR